MSKYLELKAELATLNLKIELAQAGERAWVIREIREQMTETGVDLRDLARFLDNDAKGRRQSEKK